MATPDSVGLKLDLLSMQVLVVVVVVVIVFVMCCAIIDVPVNSQKRTMNR